MVGENDTVGEGKLMRLMLLVVGVEMVIMMVEEQKIKVTESDNVTDENEDEVVGEDEAVGEGEGKLM